MDSYRSLHIRWRSSGRGDGDVRSSPAFEAALNTLASVADAIAQGIEGKRAEESLRASGQSVRLIVDGIPGLVCTMCAEGKVELVNQRAMDYMGRTLEEVKVLLNCSLPRVKLVANPQFTFRSVAQKQSTRTRPSLGPVPVGGSRSPRTFGAWEYFPRGPV